jgi:hypothetical protein
MDEQALLRLRIEALEEENTRLKQVMVVKGVELEVCKCGVPHKLYVLGFLGEEICSPI